jgi:hypothetical protein
VSTSDEHLLLVACVFFTCPWLLLPVILSAPYSVLHVLSYPDLVPEFGFKYDPGTADTAQADDSIDAD